ncbi:MAG: adenylate kinase, partial [Anaerolineales bacterium]
LGAPGAGKGTQAQIINEKLGIPHISSGDIFRDNLKNQTELGKLADGYIKAGQLVPDAITIKMIKERLSQPDCANGAILDGFPRTPEQAEALKQMLTEFNAQVERVIYISVADEVLIERLSGRWICKAQGHVYHILYNPPKVPGICDIDGSELYQRDDDKIDTVRQRIKVYHQQTQPLIEYYQNKGLLVEIDGNQPIEKISADIMNKLERM